MRNTEKPRGATASKKTRPQFTAEPFKTTQAWVKIETTVSATQDDFLRGKDGYQDAWNHDFVMGFVNEARGWLEGKTFARKLPFRTLVERNRTLGRRMAAPFAVGLTAREWEVLQELAAELAVDPAAVIRAALAAKVSDWKKFELEGRTA